jgi:hypothetical protein
MQLFVRAVVTGFGMALGGALFRKVARRIGLDEPDDKKPVAREPTEPIAPVGDPQPELA